MAFKMINESFTCENCGKTIEKHPEGSARNHCPFCLSSKHMDKDFPGDRASTCLGIMEPIGIDNKKNKGWMIKHKCKKCGKEILNKVAPDDNFLDLIKKINSNF
ncbi:MAG: RNHCP domain-containing protein [Candidatus Gracilibacteria bacterium]|nr:RNHCP domain-containing protein [Candidatus Gracilibacteria bacterium]